MRKLSLAAAVIAIQCATTGNASPYSDFYVFGDSLFDTGNFSDGLRFTNRVGPDYQNSPYGPVSPSLAAQALGVSAPAPSVEGGNNYAVGGNQSQQTLESITAATTYDSPLVGKAYNSFFYDLERSGRALDRRAVYLLDGGGNDIPAFVPATEVATNMVTAARALRERGANYVVVTNVPDFGLSPAGIIVQDYATAQSASISEQIREQIGSENILIFDAFNLIREVVANPASYGIAVSPEEVSYASFDPGNCGTCTAGNPDAKIDGSNPDPDQFFFNDTRHPTTIGQQIAADYLVSILSAPGEIALLPEMGLDDMQAHWRAAHPVMRSNRWDDSTEIGKYTVWGGAGGSENERDTDFRDTGENETARYDLGLNYRFSQRAYLGLMLSRGDSELEFDNSRSGYDMESLGVSLISGFRGARWFVEGALSYSDLDYDELKRAFDLGPVLQRTEQADTNGETYGLLINMGYNLLDSHRYRVGPVVGYEYINVDLDGYNEKGSSATALVVDDLKTITSVWNAGLFGDMQLGFCDCTVYSEASYRSFGRDGSINPRIGLVTQPGNSAVLPGYDRDDDGWRGELGLSARLNDSLVLNIEAGLEDTDNNDGVWLGGQVRYSF